MIIKQYTDEDLVFPKPCVYALFWCGRVTYVGQSVNLAGRLAGHKKVRRFDRVCAAFCKRSEMNTLEQEMIDRLRPSDNIKGVKSHGTPINYRCRLILRPFGTAR